MSLPWNSCKVITIKASLIRNSARPQSGHIRCPCELGRGHPWSSGPDMDTLHKELSLGLTGGHWIGGWGTDGKESGQEEAPGSRGSHSPP